MSHSDDKEEEEEVSNQEDTVPDLEEASSSVQAASGPVFSEEDVTASVVANNSFVAAVVISEKEDPNGDTVITAHQVDAGDDPELQAPDRQPSNQPPPPAASATEQTTTSTVASNSAPEESPLNTKIMAMKEARIATENMEAGLANDTVPQPATTQRKNRKGMLLGICLCLLAVIGIIVALVVTLSGNDEETRDASFAINGATEAPSITEEKLTSVPTTTPKVATPVPTTPSPSLNPTAPPTPEPQFCLQGSDKCGDGGAFGFGADWKSLSCVANTQTLKCTIAACNEVFPIVTPSRVLHMVSDTTNQRIEFVGDGSFFPFGFELFDGTSLVYEGTPTVRNAKTEADIELPISYFPNLENIQVWLESSIIEPFNPVDRLPDQITLSFSPC
ncbi:unnamed protein product [Cylindrotheca closterium]|uniref:Uncharacterized protein n=1 Tax=Cylindrotheca closterium TaxID=2856 RepID=A0AAD2G3E1_9STRA|nr:unnamed protein product [Cylindrotheca closterium]